MTLTTYPCSRCNGSGRLPQFANVLAGVCFKCHGSGKQVRKPSAPTLQWAVFFFDVEQGKMKHAYNCTGKSQGEAIKKALKNMERASQQFRERFDITKFFACHVSEVVVTENGILPINGFPSSV